MSYGNRPQGGIRVPEVNISLLTEKWLDGMLLKIFLDIYVNDLIKIWLKIWISSIFLGTVLLSNVSAHWISIFKNKTVDLVRNGGSKTRCVEKSIPQAGQNDSYSQKNAKYIYESIYICTCIHIHLLDIDVLCTNTYLAYILYNYITYNRTYLSFSLYLFLFICLLNLNIFFKEAGWTVLCLWASKQPCLTSFPDSTQKPLSSWSPSWYLFQVKTLLFAWFSMAHYFLIWVSLSLEAYSVQLLNFPTCPLLLNCEFFEKGVVSWVWLPELVRNRSLWNALWMNIKPSMLREHYGEKMAKNRECT